jgi:hypothetical protein
MAAGSGVDAEVSVRDGGSVVVATVMVVAPGSAWLEAEAGLVVGPGALVVPWKAVVAEVAVSAVAVVECQQAGAGAVGVEGLGVVLAVLPH